MDTELIKLAMQGGIGVAMFIVWIVTFRQMIKTTKEAFDKHSTLSESLLSIMKDEQEYKTTLTGILDRISYRLETPAQCPILIPGRKVKLEVTE